MQGEFDDLLSLHLLTPEIRNKYIKQVDFHQKKVERCIVELERLPVLYNWEAMRSDDKEILRGLADCAKHGVQLMETLKVCLATDSDLNVMEVSRLVEQIPS